MVQTVSSYKSGMIIFKGSIIVWIVLAIIIILIPPGFVVAILIASRIGKEEVSTRLNVDYYEKIILKSENLTVKYQGVEYSNLGNDFKEYYSASHEIALDESSDIASSAALNNTYQDVITVFVGDGKYTLEAVYERNVQSFVLYCMVITYKELAEKDFFYTTSYQISNKTFPYNANTNFDILVSYLVR